MGRGCRPHYKRHPRERIRQTGRAKALLNCATRPPPKSAGFLETKEAYKVSLCIVYLDFAAGRLRVSPSRPSPQRSSTHPEQHDPNVRLRARGLIWNGTLQSSCCPPWTLKPLFRPITRRYSPTS